MAGKFHVNEKGESGQCSAKKGGCPFGDESDHHETREAAGKAYEAKMSGQTIKSLRFITPAERISKLPEVKGVTYEHDPYSDDKTDEGVKFSSADVYRTMKNGSRAKLGSATVYDDGHVMVWDTSGSTEADVRARDKFVGSFKDSELKISNLSSPIFVNKSRIWEDEKSKSEDGR